MSANFGLCVVNQLFTSNCNHLENKNKVSILVQSVECSWIYRYLPLTEVRIKFSDHSFSYENRWWTYRVAKRRLVWWVTARINRIWAELDRAASMRFSANSCLRYFDFPEEIPQFVIELPCTNPVPDEMSWCFHWLHLSCSKRMCSLWLWSPWIAPRRSCACKSDSFPTNVWLRIGFVQLVEFVLLSVLKSVYW